MLVLATPAAAKPAAPGPLHLADHWLAFVAAPDKPHFDTVYAEVRACHKVCLHLNAPMADEAVAGLSRLIRQRNRLALRLSFAAHPLIKPGAADLAQSYGDIIRADPTAFLRVAYQEKAPQPVIVADAAGLPDSFADDNSSQAIELKARRTALARVGDSDLIPLRDVCLARLDADIRRFDSETVPAKPGHSRPDPQAPKKPTPETIT